jgi:hypothetical protein
MCGASGIVVSGVETQVVPEFVVRYRVLAENPSGEMKASAVLAVAATIELNVADSPNAPGMRVHVTPLSDDTSAVAFPPHV